MYKPIFKAYLRQLFLIFNIRMYSYCKDRKVQKKLSKED